MRRKYARWQGTGDDLAALVEKVVRSGTVRGASSSPNLRLIRHYLSVGAITRPERRGKEVWFGFRQLVECLVIRLLLEDGWPLAKIAELTSRASLEELLAYFPSSGPNRAQELVRRFSDPNPAPPPSYAVQQAAKVSRNRLTTQHVWSTFGVGEARPERRDVVRFVVAPWCQVDVDRQALAALPEEAVDEAGEALKQLLREERGKKGERK